MSRFGLTNICLKCGLVLMLLGLACGVAFVSLTPTMGGMPFRLLLWGATGSFFSGVVLYVIGRLIHAARHFRRA